MKKKLIPVGFTKKTHGLKGELKIVIEADFEADFMTADVVFMEIQGQQLPFFIKDIRGGNELIVKFEDCNTIEAAQPLASKTVYLQEKSLSKKSLGRLNATDALSNCTQFTIIDAFLGTIGKIEAIEQYPQQLMATIRFNNTLQLIPLNMVFVTKIDSIKQILYTTLPKGIFQ